MGPDECTTEGIHITAYSPLGNNNEGKPLLFEHPAIIEIANRHVTRRLPLACLSRF